MTLMISEAALRLSCTAKRANAAVERKRELIRKETIA
jgi:hypothetical protein